MSDRSKVAYKMAIDVKHGFRSYDLVIEPRLNRVLAGAESRSIEPRAMQVLAYLAERADQVVSKEELLDEVWSGVTVSPNVLTYSIATLRKALGEDWREPRFVETITKGGYRWIAPVDPLAGQPAAGSASPPSRSRQAQRWLSGSAAAAFAVLVAAGVLGYLAPPTLRGSTPLRARPLTALPGWEIHPALSPDGTRVAFTRGAPDGGPTDIHLQAIAASSSASLTNTPDIAESHPTWSPDGNRLAYVRRSADGTCEIWVAGMNGDAPARLASCARGPIGNLDWSPDGGSIVFDDRSSSERPRTVQHLDLATGVVRRLSAPSATDFGDRRPVYSPDGSQLVFQRARGDGLADLYVADSDGSNARRITFDNRDIGGHDWTPDGSGVVFSSYRAGQFTLWRTRLDGGPPVAIAINDHQIGALQIAGAAGVMVYSKRSLVTNIWSGQARAPAFAGSAGAGSTSSVAGTVAHRSAVEFDTEPQRLIESTMWDLHPSIAPDNSRIAFASDRSGHFEIWSSDAHGEALIQHTAFEGPFVGTVRWSPDAATLVFDARPNGHADLYVADARGGRPRRLTHESSDEFAPSFSRDGRWIYYGSNRGGSWEIWRLPSQGGMAQRVTVGGGYAALEGPQGEFVYFTRYGADGLWRVPVGGGVEAKVLDAPGLADWGNWVVSNGGIYYVQRSPGAVMFYDPDTGTSHQVLPMNGTIPYNHPSLAVSEDGTWFLVGIQESSSADLLVVEGIQ